MKKPSEPTKGKITAIKNAVKKSMKRLSNKIKHKGAQIIPKKKPDEKKWKGVPSVNPMRRKENAKIKELGITRKAYKKRVKKERLINAI